MARIVRDARLDSRSARSKLPLRREPYWVKIAKGCYLGYRRISLRSGSWLARYRDLTGRQNFRAIGPADDALDADGATALNFDQAQSRARDWFQAIASDAEGGRRGIYMVADCMADYLAWVKQHRKSWRHIDTYVNAYILPRLGKIDTARLSSGMIRKWHQQVAAEPPRLRTRPGQPQHYRDEDPNPEEARRKRQLRANRHLVTLKAALNRAWRDSKIVRNDAWTRIEQFRGTERQRSRFLSKDDARRLINACKPDMRLLVQAALLTGARYGELCRFDVGDYQRDSGTLFVRDSKSGKPRHIFLNDEGIGFFTQLTAGRSKSEPLLRKGGGERWDRDHHHRSFKEAVKHAGIEPGFTFHELRHTWASLTIMGGGPLMVVAQNLGHRDTRMIEQHYGHLANSYVSEMIRKTAPSYGSVAIGRVVPIGIAS